MKGMRRKISWSFIILSLKDEPSSVASRHLPPEGEDKIEPTGIIRSINKKYQQDKSIRSINKKYQQDKSIGRINQKI